MDGRSRRSRARRDLSAALLSAPTHSSRAVWSQFAARDEYCSGRLRPISPDASRGPYERDYHRILYSSAFKRLKHKTQVFYAPENDNICTRMDHTLQVASVAETICRELGLNVNLAKAVALGHDLGHAPFGHTGEEVLRELSSEEVTTTFMHEANSLRVVDSMMELHGEPLNLTHEVRDGIVCHCGEDHEQLVKPDRTRDVTRVDGALARVEKPCTLEGCVVRYADRIAYLPADLQDALELGLIMKKDIPPVVKSRLGGDIGEIIGKVTNNIVRISSGNDYIAVSDKVSACLQELSRFSVERIYNSPAILRVKDEVKHRMRRLFEEFLSVLGHTGGPNNRKARSAYRANSYRVFFEFVDAMKYPDCQSPHQIVQDYISGMTDSFAKKCYDELFQMSTPIRYW